MAKVQHIGNIRSAPIWAGDFGGREHILPVPGQINPAGFADSLGIPVTIVPATDEFTVTIAGGATGGNFTLTVTIAAVGQTTANIPFGSAAAVVQAAIQALSNVGAGNATVEGAASPYSVQFNPSIGVVTLTGSAAGLTGGSPTLTIGTSGTIPAGSTTIRISAPLDYSVFASTILISQGNVLIPAGTTLNFGTTKFVTLSGAAMWGDTVLSVLATPTAFVGGETTVYSKYGTLTIPSGLAVSRTLAERDAGTPFHAPVSTDDEIFLIMFDVVDALTVTDIEFYRHNGLVKENYLPGYSTVLRPGGTDSALMTALRSRYRMIVGVG